MKIRFLFSLASFSAAVFATSCNIPIIATPGQLGTYPESSEFCPPYKGSQVCCASANFTTQGVFMTTMATFIPQIESKLDSITDAEITEISAATGLPASEVKQIKSLGPQLGQCANAVFGFYRGLSCFACETNWSQFESNKVLTLSTNTCSGVYDGCNPLLKKIISIADVPSDSCDTAAKSLGKTGCKDLICSYLNYLADYNPTYAPGGLPIPSDNTPARFAATLGSIASAVHPAMGSFLARVSRRALGVSGTAVVDAGPTPPPTPSFTIAYSSSGYDAFGKGCSAYGSCPSSKAGAGGKFASIGGIGGLIGIIVGSLLVFVLLAVVITRANRTSHSNAGLPITAAQAGPRYAALGDGAPQGYQPQGAYPYAQPNAAAPGQSLYVQSMYAQPQPQHPAFK